MDRNISVVKDVFITCVLLTPKVSSAVGKKQCRWCREISDQCSCLVTTMERERFVIEEGLQSTTTVVLRKDATECNVLSATLKLNSPLSSLN